MTCPKGPAATAKRLFFDGLHTLADIPKQKQNTHTNFCQGKFCKIFSYSGIGLARCSKTEGSSSFWIDCSYRKRLVKVRKYDILMGIDLLTCTRGEEIRKSCFFVVLHPLNLTESNQKQTFHVVFVLLRSHIHLSNYNICNINTYKYRNVSVIYDSTLSCCFNFSDHLKFETSFIQPQLLFDTFPFINTYFGNFEQTERRGTDLFVLRSTSGKWLMFHQFRLCYAVHRRP